MQNTVYVSERIPKTQEATMCQTTTTTTFTTPSTAVTTATTAAAACYIRLKPSPTAITPADCPGNCR